MGKLSLHPPPGSLTSVSITSLNSGARCQTPSTPWTRITDLRDSCLSSLLHRSLLEESPPCYSREGDASRPRESLAVTPDPSKLPSWRRRYYLSSCMCCMGYSLKSSPPFLCLLDWHGRPSGSRHTAASKLLYTVRQHQSVLGHQSPRYGHIVSVYGLSGNGVSATYVRKTCWTFPRR